MSCTSRNKYRTKDMVCAKYSKYLSAEKVPVLGYRPQLQNSNIKRACVKQCKRRKDAVQKFFFYKKQIRITCRIWTLD